VGFGGNELVVADGDELFKVPERGELVLDEVRPGGTEVSADGEVGLVEMKGSRK
jgi:hypothetical protein